MLKWVGVLTFCVVIGFVILVHEMPGRIPPLRSEHSEPASIPPSEPVAVTPDGKQFHDPSCKYIHGKPQMMSSQEAIERGYTPDPRCMEKALTKHHQPVSP